MSTVLLSVNQLSKSYGGRQAVDGVSFQVRHGQTLIGFQGDAAAPTAILLKNHGLHFEIQVDASTPVGQTDAAGVKDILMEAALTTIMDCEDSVAAVDADDKVVIYRNWLGLMKGDLAEEVAKGGKTFTRTMNADRTYAGGDGGVLPRTANAHRFAEAPEIVDGAGPDGGLAVGRADDVGVGPRGIGGEAGHEEESAPGGVVVNAAVVRGDGADLGDAAGVFGGEFEEGASGVEEVALGADLAHGAFGIGEGVVGAAAGQAPTAVLLVGVDDRGGVEGDGVAGDGDVGLHPRGGTGFGARTKDEVGAHFVKRVADGEAEGFLLGAAGVEEAADRFGRGVGGEGGEERGGRRRAKVG
eukprot:gene32041-39578_t